MIAFFLGVTIYLPVRNKKIDYNYYQQYYKKDLNGIVKQSITTRGGELIFILESDNTEYRTGISSYQLKSIETGDSISKPVYSEYLFQFRNRKGDRTWEYSKIEKFDEYKWKRPWSYEASPDWK